MTSGPEVLLKAIFVPMVLLLLGSVVMEPSCAEPAPAFAGHGMANPAPCWFLLQASWPYLSGESLLPLSGKRTPQLTTGVHLTC